MYSSNL